MQRLLAVLCLSAVGCASPTDTAQPPNNAPADAPGTADNTDAHALALRVTGYELHGCSGMYVTGCVTAYARKAGPSSEGWFIAVNCDTDQFCNLSVGSNRVDLYNLKAERLFASSIGNPPVELPNGVVVYGLARIGHWPDASFSNSVPDVVPLAVTRIYFNDQN